MGVPAFFRWLSMKYPSIVTHCVEKRGSIIDDSGTRTPVNLTDNNPNDIEFDNLYLDMNGIIHPCTHPENKPAPKTESEMFVAIFEYIDRLISIIRPRRVLYMAIDGVAPRAKMNQQRSRRFRSAKESREKAMTVERLRSELLARGAHLPDPSDSEHFDSNCITPGTPFMARLAEALRGYIYNRLTNNPGWKDLLVLLSDANVPGEGEHKIIDFIRRQRNSPSHDANTRHCLCGADADLIMLGLATHEPYFTIIREEFKPNQPKPCDLCGQVGHEMVDCVGAPKDDEDVSDRPPPMPTGDVDFIFIHLDVLRQYLSEDLKLTGISFDWDLERVIDDWVFMCFFVGNDFLPHLPSLEIRENAIDRLIEIYKYTVRQTDGWLTDSGKVHFDRVQRILVDLGKMEDDIFQNRRDSELKFRSRKKQQQNWQQPQRPGRQYGFDNQAKFMQPVALTGRQSVTHPQGRYSGSAVTAAEVYGARRNATREENNVNWVDRNLNNLEAATTLRAMLKDHNSHKHSATPDYPSVAPAKMRIVEKNDSLDDEDAKMDAADEVRFWEEGWRSRYYQSKFGVDPEDAPEFCSNVSKQYAYGLCWVLAYYYQGCVSWDWYFPYHYAPFASDFGELQHLDPEFEKIHTQPFRPLEQLMSVFPADSRSHVPPAWQDLMTDPNSPIIDFYPSNFKVDLNGKRFLWMGVALLPFVDEKRLLKALDERRSMLTEAEVKRNIRGPDRLFCHRDHELGPLIESVYKSNSTQSKDDGGEEESKDKLIPSSASIVDPRLTNGLSGLMWSDVLAYQPGTCVPSGVPGLVKDLKCSKAFSACYSDPQYPSGYMFVAKLLKRVTLPPPVVLKPPERGRGRGSSRGFHSNSDHPRGRFNAASAMQHYARDSSSDREEDRSAMERMIYNSLPHNNRYNNKNNNSMSPSRSNYRFSGRANQFYPRNGSNYPPRHMPPPPGCYRPSYMPQHATNYSTGMSDGYPGRPYGHNYSRPPSRAQRRPQPRY